MDVTAARQLLIDRLQPRYGAGEAASIARIVLEDAFQRRGSSGGPALSAAEQDRLQAILRRLEGGEPVQYVLGQADFFGLTFAVGPAVLIPRQETEELVAWVLDWLGRRPGGAQVLDIGLGSGCIGITLKKKRRDIELYGLEKSPEALLVARENARRWLGEGNFTFLEGDILQPSDWALFPPLDAVVSNPPYIPPGEAELVPPHVRDHEPALALFTPADDPLAFYRAIAAFSRHKLRPGGGLFLECNEFNAGEVSGLLRAAGFGQVELRRDLAGAERMVFGLNG
jgi:release factor glutamine methyltransferase